jgi:SAM-dependent methyltransferase
LSSFACPICDAVTAHPLYHPLIQCDVCGLVCTDPHVVPTPDVALYDQGYFTERNAYLAQATAFAAAFARILALTAGFKPGGQLVDIGCGPGLLLNLARQRGYMVKGCDVSPWAAQYARDLGLDVQTGDLHSVDYPTGQFDVAIVNHTLEHVANPRGFLEEVYRILAPGGIVVVGVPNFASLMSQMLRGRWAGLLPDQHLWHFTPQTLQQMLRNTNFCTAQLVIEPHVHHHPNRLKDITLQVLSWTANRLGRGDSLLAVAQKCDDDRVGR